MIWRYYLPHRWERERQVWEDVYLLPDDPEFAQDALWLTVDALGFYEGDERAKAKEKLEGGDYWIDGLDMIINLEDFSKAELLESVGVWLHTHQLPLTELIEGSYEEFAGRMPRGRNLLAGEAAGEAGDQDDNDDKVYIDPDLFTEVSPDADTGHKYKLVLPRKLYQQIEAMPEQEAEELMRIIASLADNPTPPGAKRLSDE